MSVRGEVGFDSSGLVGWSVSFALAADTEAQAFGLRSWTDVSGSARVGPTVGGAPFVLEPRSRPRPLVGQFYPDAKSDDGATGHAFNSRPMAQTAGKPVIVQWIVDTRELWPSADKTAQLETVVRGPSLLTLRLVLAGMLTGGCEQTGGEGARAARRG